MSISIHAPLTGRDIKGDVHNTSLNVISIHAPLTGRDSKNAQMIFCIFAITDN